MSCQYSVTVPINKQAADWLFYGVDAHDQHPTLREIKCDLGGAIFYMGERLSHWRKELQSDYSYHMFLHYVDLDDPERAEYKFDKRQALGVPRA